MKVPLSPRLRACCNFIAPGDRVADVGTDHGYLGIWLLRQGIARSVIAPDIVPGPLSAARANGEKFGCLDRMEFCLADGLRGVPRDFDTAVCAGMGADTIISILQGAPWLRGGHHRLVLQCQSKTPMLRRFLGENGWRIHRETVLRDGRFLYTVMECLWDPECCGLTPGQWYLSPALLAAGDPELGEYIQRVLEGLRLAVDHRAEPDQRRALEELEEILSKEDVYDYRQ